jgi:hypothetical protein
MCLGAGETTVLKLATAYGSIVNGGYKITPILIQNITDRQGKILTPPQQGPKESLIGLLLLNISESSFRSLNLFLGFVDFRLMLKRCETV